MSLFSPVGHSTRGAGGGKRLLRGTRLPLYQLVGSAAAAASLQAGMLAVPK